ncbi:SDR family oxidoreductase [Pseudonocardia sp. CA-142604]|uniref:SDR family oxidoreductase n=1 Tax=Pseudonocardia sp. CA-142604 TaxID=3240024 RepID=UPI003D8CAE32
MGSYAVTGSASGIGAAVTERLRAAGHSVIEVDLRDTDVVADLGAPEGRPAAATGVLGRSGGVLDGAVLAAGIGPSPGPYRPRKIAQVNQLGTVELLTALRPAFAASGDARAVVLGSNSATVTPGVPRRVLRALRTGEVDRGADAATVRAGRPEHRLRGVEDRGDRLGAPSGRAPAWAGAGIRLNVLAPGPVQTPLLDEDLANPVAARAVRAFPVPVGGVGGSRAPRRLGDDAALACGGVPAWQRHRRRRRLRGVAPPRRVAPARRPPAGAPLPVALPRLRPVLS